MWRSSPTRQVLLNDNNNDLSGGDRITFGGGVKHMKLGVGGTSCEVEENNDGEQLPGFIKLPHEDRNKYKKLDITSNSDSDSEFYANDLHDAKKTIFSIVSGNINLPEKLQAVYNKVDKPQIKVPNMKKLRNKVEKMEAEAKKSSKRWQQQEEQAKKSADAALSDGDSDSIGSASDLRANDDVEPTEKKQKNKTNLRQPQAFDAERANNDDIFSDAVTCASSNYHAEAESLATQGDDASRIVTRVRKRKDRSLNDSTQTIVVEDQPSPVHQGDKPLLLDDELDYDSSEGTEKRAADKSDAGAIHSEDDDDDEASLDVFALAPFSVSVGGTKRPKPKKLQPVKYKPTATTIPEHTNLFDFDAIGPTSTPCKEPDHFNDTPFAQFGSNIQSQSDFGIVTVTGSCGANNQYQLPPPPLPPPTTVHSDKDLFGEDVAFPNAVICMPSFSKAPNVSPNSNIDFPKSAQPILVTVAPDLVTVNQSIVLNRSTFALPPPTPAQYVVSAAVTPSGSSMLTFDATSDDDESLATALSKSKKDKNKYSHLKEAKSKKDEPSATTSIVLGLPQKLSQKVKVSSGYKKVSNKTSKSSAIKLNFSDTNFKAAEGVFNNLTTSSKAGFANMSFEDFPSDQEIDLHNSFEQATTKSTPFEVVRNEKMLIEAEKKFGSLKRRSNPFS
jgi:AP2-associated kinase